MSFKKVGINYISDKLLKCLLQDGSKYYVELKNGIRIPVAQADYEAIATDLVVVNGVAYADLSVIASCKQLVGGYIVEFANGNQLTTTELNFNALVEAGFCAIGDTYYNPSQIDKLYEADGAYFAVMANGQRVGMSEDEYEAIVGGEPGPEPAGLTPFAVNDVITGGTTKIKVDQTALNVDTFLAGLNYSDGICYLVYDQDSDAIVVAANADGVYLLTISDDSSDTGKVIYASADLQEIGITAGWHLDANDEATYGNSSPLTVTNIIDTVPATWNGVLLGIAQ